MTTVRADFRNGRLAAMQGKVEFASLALMRNSSDGLKKIVVRNKFPVLVTNGLMPATTLDPGAYRVWITLIGFTDGPYDFTVPASGDWTLFELIESSVTMPRPTVQAQMEAAVAAYLVAHPPSGGGGGGSSTVDTLGGTGAGGRAVMKASDAAAVRAVIDAATPAQITTAVNALVNAAPSQLDTLKELSDALGGDQNFASTVTGLIGAKYTKPVPGVPKADLTTGVQGSLTRADSAVLTVNGTSPDGSGNVVVAAGGSGGGPSAAALGNTTAATTVDVAGAAGKIFRATLAVASTAFTFTNVVAGARWLMEIRQDTSGGRAATWSGVTWVPLPPVIATAVSAVNLFEFFSPDGTTIYGSLLNPSTGGVTLPYAAPPSRLEPLPRVLTSGEMSMTTGQLWLQHFTPDRDFVVSNILTHQSGTVSAGGTLAKVGIYRYNGGSSYSCIARSANVPGRWNTAGENVAPVVDNGAASPAAITSIALQAGVEYAYGTLLVGASTNPQMRALSVSDKGTLNPRMGVTLYSQTDLASAVTASIPTWALFWAAFT